MCAGLDIDWEYPKDDHEARNLVHLLKQTRHVSLPAADMMACIIDRYQELNACHKGKHMLLTVACPAGPQNYEKMHLKAMDEHLDFWNLMAYDYAGSWDSHAGHQANLYPSHANPKSTPFSTSAAVKYYTSHGVAPAKLILGMPLYGRAFTATDGPGTLFSGTGEGSWENGVWDFKSLPKSGAMEMFDDETGSSWSYDAVKKVMISYDTKEVARQKVEFIKKHRLGGYVFSNPTLYPILPDLG